MTEACPDCGDSFEKVGLHWSRGSCNYPTPDDRVDDILTGLYMGDGSLAAHDSKNPYMRWNNTNKKFLEYVDSRLKWLSTGVRLKKSAEESAQQRLDRNQEGWTVNPENFNPVYATRTRRLPYFRKFKRWTEASQKRYPDDVELTPTVAKYWYASDGTVNWMRTHSARIAFACRNEQDREQFMLNLFDKSGFEVKRNNHMYYLSVRESEAFLDWMGSPVPGFEYKWEIDSRKRYEKLIDTK